MTNINKLFNGRNNAINIVDDYDSMITEAKRKAAGEELATEPEAATELREEFLNRN